MKRIRLIVLSCVAIMISSLSPAYSAEGFYASGNLGLAMLRDTNISNPSFDEEEITVESKFKKGLALGVAGGYDFGNNIRLEGEVAYQKNALDKATATSREVDVDVTDILDSDFSSLALLVNGYYDIKKNSPVIPYLSAGVGFVKVKIDFSDSDYDSEDDTVFAYHIGAGVGYAINKTLTLDTKYRYLGASDPKFDDTKIEYSSHNFSVGLRVSF
jgi:opacity protein-like surface antigen